MTLDALIHNGRIRPKHRLRGAQATLEVTSGTNGQFSKNYRRIPMRSLTIRGTRTVRFRHVLGELRLP